MEDADFWKDKTKSEKVISEFNSLKKVLDDIATKLAENPVTTTPQAELAKLNF